jgi:hypothetical protein
LPIIRKIKKVVRTLNMTETPQNLPPLNPDPGLRLRRSEELAASEPDRQEPDNVPPQVPQPANPAPVNRESPAPKPASPELKKPGLVYSATVNPWLAIWLHPRQAIRTILDHDPEYQVKILAISFGVLQMLPGALKMEIALMPRILGVLIGGTLGGFIGLYLFGWLYRVAGHWFGGQAESVETRAAMTWAQMPNLAGSVILSFVLLIFKGPNPAALWLTIFQAALLIVCSLWSLILICHTVGEAHRFSTWKGFLTVSTGNTLPALLVLVLIALFAIMLPGVLKQITHRGPAGFTKPAILQQAAKMPDQLNLSKIAAAGKAIPLPLKGKAPARVPAALPAPVKQKVEIPGVSDAELETMRFSGKPVRISLASGKVLTGMVLDVSMDSLFVEVNGMAVNIPKKDISGFEKTTQ